jgi:hypothetical protein
MRHYAGSIAAGLLAVLLAAGGARAGEEYRVAVLDFETTRAKDTKAVQWGAEVADLLTALLSAEPGLQLVERADLEGAIREHKLNLTGLVGGEDRVKLGRLVGAQFLVIGRVFPIDKDVCIVAKVVSVETSRMTAEVVQGKLSGELAPVVRKLAGKVGAAIRKKAPVLLPRPRFGPDVLATIRKGLGKGPLPAMLVSVTESHRSPRPARGADPAAATEFTFLLRSCGFDVTEEESAKRVVDGWAKRFLRDTDAAMPNVLAGVDVVLVGQGFSEFGARTGDLVTCLARLEVQAVDTRTGRALAIGRTTTRAIDLAEGIAAKTALQKAAATIAERLIPEAVGEWRKAHPDLVRERKVPRPPNEKAEEKREEMAR